MKNIHIISTDKPSRLHEFGDVWFSHKEPTECFRNYNIYITSSEEIKEGDWYIYLGQINKRTRKNPKAEYSFPTYKKIILTTDQDLIKDGIQPIDEEFLEYYVSVPYGEIKEIEVEDNREMSNEFIELDTMPYKIIIPKEELKQEITIEEIEQQITITEARGERVVKYLDKYKGQSIYNEIALAIEFGYQLKLEEDE
jgi:hypothetical protein